MQYEHEYSSHPGTREGDEPNHGLDFAVGESRERVYLSPSPVPRMMPVQENFGFGLTRGEWMDSAEWLWDVMERAGMALEGIGGPV